MAAVLEQLVNFGFFQSLLLLFIYLFSPRNRNQINGYLAFLVLVLAMGLSGKVIYNFGFFEQNFRLIAVSEFSMLLFGPTIYLFVRSTLKKAQSSKADLVHYIPAFFYSLFIATYFIAPGDTIIGERISTGELSRVIYACHAIGLIVNVTYFVLGCKVYRDFLIEMKDEASYEIRSRFMNNFLFVIAVCLGVWLALYLLSLSGFDMIERNARPYIWILLTFIILFISYYSMISPEVLRFVPDSKHQKYRLSKLSNQDLEDLKTRLDSIMLEKKPYLNQKLLKKELADLLGVSNPELARLLNENIGMNFFEYVNYYRIKEFIELTNTEKGKQLTFFGLAQEAGFNSKTTFNKAFKSLMGASPSEYFKEKL